MDSERSTKQSQFDDLRIPVVLDQLLNTSPHQIFVKDRNLRVVLCNAAYAETIGKRPAELCGRTEIENGWQPVVGNRVSRSGQARVERSDREVLDGKASGLTEEQFRIGADIRIFHTVKLPLRGPDGEIIGFVGVRRDVTEPGREVPALSKRQFERLLDPIEEPVLVYETGGNILACNEAAIRRYGYTRDELLRITMDRISSPGWSRSAKRQTRASRTTKPTLTESVHRSKDGSEFAVEVRESAIELDGRSAVLGVVRKATAQARISDSPADSKRRDLNFAEGTSIGAFECDLDGVLSDADEAALRMLEFEDASEVAAGKAVLRFRKPRGRRRFRKLPSKDLSVDAFAANLVTRNGSMRQVLVSLATKAGVISGVMIDIGNAQRSELALRTTQTRLRHLSHLLLEAQEKERKAIAGELHDEIGQLLTAMKIDLQGVRLDSFAGEADTRIARTIGTVDRCLAEIRDLSLRLRPSILDDLGLLPALRWQAESLAPRFGLDVEIRGTELPARLEPSLEVVCYRVSQEALTNVARHAAARTATVSLELAGKELLLSICDDGIGFDVRAAERRFIEGRSFGLPGIQERVALAGGTVEIRSRRGKGTKLMVRLPARFIETAEDTV